MKYRKHDGFIRAMANRHIMYNETVDYISEKERAGKLLVIRPDVALPVSRVEKDPEKLRKAYEIGRKITSERIKDIIKFLEK